MNDGVLAASSHSLQTLVYLTTENTHKTEGTKEAKHEECHRTNQLCFSLAGNIDRDLKQFHFIEQRIAQHVAGKLNNFSK